MELTEKEREKISYLVSDILESRNIEMNPEWDGDYAKEHDFECLLTEFEGYLTMVENYDKKPSYIYALFDGEEQIDQTSLDEMNENLAWEIMVEDEGRNPKGLSVILIDEVQEDDN